MQNGLKTPLKSFKINSMKPNIKKDRFMILGKKIIVKQSADRKEYQDKGIPASDFATTYLY